MRQNEAGCHPEQALFAQRRIWASRAKCRASCDTRIARLARSLPSTIFIHHRKTRTSTHESNQSMDHLPHPFLGQSKTTHHQPHLHRRPRPSALRTQGRLSGRILRWCSPHRPSPDLRGYLRPFARQRNSRAASNSTTARNSATAGNTAAPNRDPLSASGSQVSSTRPRISHARAKPSLALRLTQGRAFGWRSAFSAATNALLEMRALAPEVLKPSETSAGKFTTDSPTANRIPQRNHPQRPHHRGRAALQRRVLRSKSIRALARVSSHIHARFASGQRKTPNTIHLSGRARLQSCRKHSRRSAALAAEVNLTSFCERPMNPTCGKPIHHPRIKPVIAGDTTCSVSLLTGTISGSNFAIP